MSVVSDRIKSFLRKAAHSDFFAFNLRNRDRWIAEQAAKISSGKIVLDVGAGSAPYRGLFSQGVYKTQDFAALRPEQLRGETTARLITVMTLNDTGSEWKL